MELGRKWQTTSKEEDNWRRCGLVELQQSLQVHLVVLIYQLHFLVRQDEAGHAGEQDGHTVHLLDLEGSRRVGSVTSSQATM